MNKLLLIASPQGNVGRISRMLPIDGYELIRSQGPRALETLRR